MHVICHSLAALVWFEIVDPKRTRQTNEKRGPTERQGQGLDGGGVVVVVKRGWRVGGGGSWGVWVCVCVCGGGGGGGGCDAS